MGCTFKNVDVVLLSPSVLRCLLVVGGLIPMSLAAEDISSHDDCSDGVTNTSNHHGTDHTGHAAHQYHALFYLFNSILIGTAVVHVTTYVDFFKGIQPTVALFVLGMGYALFIEVFDLTDSTGFLGTSYNMWMDIDPHLLLFTLLPVLLTGDAMNIDTSVARLVAKQCLYLAGPGVLMCSFLTALFLYSYLPYDWSFLLCLTVGAIMTATDPVAVVALLKELGASPILTVQIQGESLLNDGTAIVLYTIAYNMTGGQDYDHRDILMFLLKTAFCAWFLGTFIGTIFAGWIRAASSRVEHSSAMIQASLTLCCAYMSFYIAEGVLEISGVLSTVAAALVLADSIWPHVVCKQAMHEVWHMLEYFANTAIFFLGGSLTAKSMIGLKFKDYLHLVYIYIVLTFVRGFVILGSLPILRFLSPDRTPVSKAEAIVMTWGGLRGAVGLALAISVNIDRAGGAIKQEDADRVLFFTAGIATLTLVVNASTCPWLVKFAGITKTPMTKRHIVANIHQQLVEIQAEMCHSPATTAIIDQRLEEMREDIFHEQLPKRKGRRDERDPAAGQRKRGTRHTHQDYMSRPRSILDRGAKMITDSETWAPSGNQVVNELEEAKLRLDRVSTEDLELLGEMPPLILLEKENEMIDMVRTVDIDNSMQRALSEVFLMLVRSQYWVQIDAGRFAPGTKHAEILLNSISSALHHSAEGLTDLAFIEETMGLIPLAARPLDEQEPGRLSSLWTGIRGQFKRLLHRGETLELTPPDEPTEQPTTVDFATASLATEDGQGHQDHDEMSKAVSLRTTYTSVSTVSPTHQGAPLRNLLSPRSPSARKKKMRRNESSSLHVQQSLDQLAEETPNMKHSESWAMTTNSVRTIRGLSGKLRKVSDSAMFNFFMMFVIVINTLLLLVEDNDSGMEPGLGWVISDFIFTLIFLIEFLLKFGGMGLKYFKDGWNALDFMCVLLAVIGLLGRLHWSDVTSKEADIMKLNRVFRVMRLARAFGLVQTTRIFWARYQRFGIDPQLAKHLDTMTVMVAYARAHILSHSVFLKYFGERGTFETCEEVRCLLESRAGIYTALYRAARVSRKISKDYLQGLNAVHESLQVSKEMGDFVMSAHEAGILNQQEAEVLYGPLKQHVAMADTLFRDSHLGIMRIRDLHCFVGEEDDASEVSRSVHFAGGSTFEAGFHRVWCRQKSKSKATSSQSLWKRNGLHLNLVEADGTSSSQAGGKREKEWGLTKADKDLHTKTGDIDNHSQEAPIRDGVTFNLTKVHYKNGDTLLPHLDANNDAKPQQQRLDEESLFEELVIDENSPDTASRRCDNIQITQSEDDVAVSTAGTAALWTNGSDPRNVMPAAPQPLAVSFTAPPTPDLPRLLPGSPACPERCDGLPGTRPATGQRRVVDEGDDDLDSEEDVQGCGDAVPGCVVHHKDSRSTSSKNS